MELFSTITSPAFSELAIFIGAGMAIHLPQAVVLFKTLGKMNEVRSFKLVFLLDSSKEEVRQRLMGALDLVTAKGLLDFLDSPPTTRWVQFHRYG